MKTKTIKLNKGEYTNLEDIFNEHDLVILTGARGSGKSYPSAKKISKILEEDTESKFLYLRIFDNELSTYGSWCKDLELNKLADYPERTELVRGKPNKGDITLRGYDEEDTQIFERVIGKCVSLESSAVFKSGKYDEFKCAVFEEYTRKKMNPATERNYVFNFLENMITFFRDRKKLVIIIGNSFANVPLLDRAIDELTGEMFINPIKIKIFRKGISNTNNFMSYINGEIFDDESFKVNVSEFEPLIVTKKYIINKHLIHAHKYYVQANTNKTKMVYREKQFLDLKYFVQYSSMNEFYYQNPSIEKQFIFDYDKVLAETTTFTATIGRRFIV